MKLTKKDATEIANRRLRYGHFRRSDTERYAQCPGCREEISAYLTAAQRQRESAWTPALRAALVEHLQMDCPSPRG